MASNINFEDIDETFPKPGVDNPSQGFRDNFTVIKDSLETAKDEISTLQSTAAKLNEENNFNGNVIKQAKFANCVQEAFTRTTPSIADQVVDFANGNYQEFRLDKNTNFILEGWPQSDGYAYIKLALFSTSDVSHIATFRSGGSGTVAYDQETTFTELDTVDGEPVQSVIRGMSSSQLIGSDIKVYEFWTKTSGSLVYARYLGIYNPSAPSSAGNNTLSTSSLTVLNSTELKGPVALTQTTGNTLDVSGNSVFKKDVVIEGDLIVNGVASASLTGVTVSSIGAIGDVDILDPAAGDILRYDGDTERWTNSATPLIVNYTLTIDDDGSGTQPVIFIDGSPLQDYQGNQTTLSFKKDVTYKFFTGDLSFSGKTLRFSTTPDTSVPLDITPYTENVTTAGVAGEAGSYTQIRITDSTPSPLYFYTDEPQGVDTALYGAAYPISVNNGPVRVLNKKYFSIGNQNISVDTTLGPVTIVLPIISQCTPGMFVTVIDNGNAEINNITIERNGGTINNEAVNKIINVNFNSITLINDGTGKWSISDPLTNGGVIQSSTESNSITTGALQVRGGVGISKNVNIGGNINSAGALNVSKKIVLGVVEHNDQETFDLNYSSSYSFVNGNETGTLSAGEEGQVYTIGMLGSGVLEVTVVNSAWNLGSAGLIVFDQSGQSVTMQYMGGRWFCISNNGCRFGAPGDADGATTGNTLDDLTNVSFVAPLIVGQVLKWDGAKWTNGADAT